MEEKNRIDQIIEYIYLAVYGAFVYVAILNASLLKLSHPNNVLRDVCLYFMLLVVVYRMNKLQRHFFEVLIILGICAVFYKVGNGLGRPLFYFYGAFIASAEAVDFKKIARTSLTAVLAALGCIGILILMGRLPDGLYPHGDGFAHCFGFSYYSTVPFYLFYCFLLYLYIKKKTAGWIEIALWLVANQLLYAYFTLSLTYGLTLIVTVLYVLIIKLELVRIDTLPVKIFSFIGFPAGMLLSCIGMLYYNSENRIWSLLNRISHNRIQESHKGIERYNITIWGQKIAMQGNSITHETTDYFYIDSAMIYSLLGFGLIFTVMIVGMYIYLHQYSCWKNDKMLFIYVTAVLLFAIMNNTWISMVYNPILALVPAAIAEQFRTGPKKPEQDTGPAADSTPGT